MRPLPLRLHAGDDLRRTLEGAVHANGCEAAFVVSGIGSLREASVRFAGREQAEHIAEPLEILSLAGTLGHGCSHLHVSLADAQGTVAGGHLGYGSVVRTTAEVLLVLLDGHAFTREPDDATGYAELVIRPRAG